ncbi:MAG: hypothetical protein BAJALOKI1v1_2310003 [Promethearchaeota archaeon]|nr:MAG: hypothetical protein BAJALOKI1v1_2310003 [Candidatus Lokiarchaeota archaeon]
MTHQLDEVDRNIIKVVQAQPTITQTDIAKQVDRSQPTVGMRVERLRKMGLLQFQAGLNLRVADLFLTLLEIETNHAQEILKLVKTCPLMINAFRLSGSKNVGIILASKDMKYLDKMINHHFRNNPLVKSCLMNFITEILEDLVLPMEFDFDNCGCPLKDLCIKSWNF